MALAALLVGGDAFFSRSTVPPRRLSARPLTVRCFAADDPDRRVRCGPKAPPRRPPPRFTSGYPNADNTGIPPGTVLAPYTGPWTITSAGTTLSGIDFTGSHRLVIRAADVTITDSKFENNEDNSFLVSMADNTPGASLVITDSEFVGAGADFRYDQMGIRGHGWTLLRVNGHDLENIGGDDGDDTVADSFFHDFPTDNPTCDHLDGFQSLGATDNVTIRHNTVIMNPTACVSAPIQLGTEYGYGGHDILVADNLLAGGAHVVYCGDGARTLKGQTVHDWNVRITGNRFATKVFPTYGQYSVSDHCDTGTGVTWTDNTDATTAAAVAPDG